MKDKRISFKTMISLMIQSINALNLLIDLIVIGYYKNTRLFFCFVVTLFYKYYCAYFNPYILYMSVCKSHPDQFRSFLMG